MVDEMYVPKGSFYNFEESDPDITGWGIAGRAQSWAQAHIAIEELIRRQLAGELGGPPDKVKLKVWKNRYAKEWPWFFKWVTKEQVPWDAREEAP